MNHKINLFVNDIYSMASINYLSHFDSNILELKLKNKKNHFFINSFSDTKGDGYCFFHSIIHLIEQKIPDWKDKVFSDNNVKILTFEQINKLIAQL